MYAEVIYGWSSVFLPILLNEGFFSENCHPDEVSPCQSQMESLDLVSTIVSGVSPILNVVTGVLLDRKGCWFTRTLLLFISTTGFALVPVARTTGRSRLTYVAFLMIGLGGFDLLTASLQVGNLTLPRYRALAVTVISGAFDSRAATLLAARELYFAGVSFDAIFFTLAALSLLFHVRVHAAPGETDRR